MPLGASSGTGIETRPVTQVSLWRTTDHQCSPVDVSTQGVAQSGTSRRYSRCPLYNPLSLFGSGPTLRVWARSHGPGQPFPLHLFFLY